jgi:hypothetical protein
MANPFHSPRSGKFNRKTRALHRAAAAKQPRNTKGRFSKKSRKTTRKNRRTSRR